MCLGTQEFDKLYQRLGIEITERGESFYNPMLPVRFPLPTQSHSSTAAQHALQLLHVHHCNCRVLVAWVGMIAVTCEVPDICSERHCHKAMLCGRRTS